MNVSFQSVCDTKMNKLYSISLCINFFIYTQLTLSAFFFTFITGLTLHICGYLSTNERSSCSGRSIRKCFQRIKILEYSSSIIVHFGRFDKTNDIIIKKIHVHVFKSKLSRSSISIILNLEKI